MLFVQTQRFAPFRFKIVFLSFFLSGFVQCGNFIGYVDLKNIFASQTDKIKKYALT